MISATLLLTAEHPAVFDDAIQGCPVEANITSVLLRCDGLADGMELHPALVENVTAFASSSPEPVPPGPRVLVHFHRPEKEE